MFKVLCMLYSSLKYGWKGSEDLVYPYVTVCKTMCIWNTEKIGFSKRWSVMSGMSSKCLHKGDRFLDGLFPI